MQETVLQGGGGTPACEPRLGHASPLHLSLTSAQRRRPGFPQGASGPPGGASLQARIPTPGFVPLPAEQRSAGSAARYAPRPPPAGPAKPAASRLASAAGRDAAETPPPGWGRHGRTLARPEGPRAALRRGRASAASPPRLGFAPGRPRGTQRAPARREGAGPRGPRPRPARRCPGRRLRQFPVRRRCRAAAAWRLVSGGDWRWRPGLRASGAWRRAGNSGSSSGRRCWLRWGVRPGPARAFLGGRLGPSFAQARCWGGLVLRGVGALLKAALAAAPARRRRRRGAPWGEPLLHPGEPGCGTGSGRKQPGA